MRWLDTFVCKECGHVFEDLVERTEEVPCPECEAATKRLSATQTSPTYGKHGSWGEWRMQQDWDKPGK